jgi:type IV secretory pathway VirB10-like protein
MGRVMSAPAAPGATSAAPSLPPVAPVLASAIFRASQRPAERSKITNFAAGIAALLVVAAAGYLGAMSGKQKAAPEPAQAEPSAAAKVDPPTPVATALPHVDPPPAPSPTAESPPTPRAREVLPEPPPRRTASEEEPPRARKTTSEDEPARPRKAATEEEPARARSSETARPSRSRATRPAADEESAGPPETRLPDSSEAPPARPTIDQGALRAAFAEGEAKAKACLGATSPTGTARFSVTFAPTGEVVGAIISGAPFANTLEGQCMTAKFRSVRVPPFTGGEVIVRKSISFL